MAKSSLTTDKLPARADAVNQPERETSVLTQARPSMSEVLSDDFDLEKSLSASNKRRFDMASTVTDKSDLAGAFKITKLLQEAGVIDENGQRAIRDAANVTYGQTSPAGMWSAIKNNWNNSRLNIEIGLWRWDEMSNQVSPGESEAAIAKLRSLQRDIYAKGLAGWLGDASGLLRFSLETAAAGNQVGVATGLGYAGAAAAVAGPLGQAGPQAALPEEIGTIGGPFVVGYLKGAVVGGAYHMSKIEAGLMYDELMQMGVPASIARPIAATVGVANGLLEIAQIKDIISTIPGGKKLLQKAQRDCIKKLVETKALKNFLVQAGVRYGKHIAYETSVEIAQEANNIVFGQLARSISNRLYGTEIPPPGKGEIVDRIIDTARASAKGFAVIAGPGNLVQTVSEAKDSRAAASVKFKMDKVQHAPEDVVEVIKRVSKTMPAAQVVPRVDIGLMGETMPESQAASSPTAQQGVVEANVLPAKSVVAQKTAKVSDKITGTKVTDEFKHPDYDAEKGPLVVYHGSPSGKIEKFDTTLRGTNTDARTAQLGIFFTNDPEVAAGYAGKTRADDSKTTEAYLNMQKPFIVKSSNPYVDSFSILEDAIIDFARDGGRNKIEMWDDVSLDDVREYADYLKVKGYDGIIIKETAVDAVENGHTQFIVFSPEQVEIAQPTAQQGVVETYSEFTQRRNTFTKPFNDLLNNAAIDAARNKGKVSKVIRAGTVRDAISPTLHQYFSDEVLSTEIVFASKINGEDFRDFAIGTGPNGKPLIAMHPEQAGAQYVPGLLHEIKHVADKLAGKEVSITGLSPTDYAAYKRLPSERRAEGFAKLLYQKQTPTLSQPTAQQPAAQQGAVEKDAVSQLEEYKDEQWAKDALSRVAKKEDYAAKEAEAEAAIQTATAELIAKENTLASEIGESVSPSLYIGNVTARMKKVWSAALGILPDSRKIVLADPTIDAAVADIKDSAEIIRAFEEEGYLAAEELIEEVTITDPTGTDKDVIRLRLPEPTKKHLGKGAAAKIGPFTEEGWPVKRAKIKMTRQQALRTLVQLEESIQQRLDNNQVNTDSDIARISADWGDVKELRKSLDLPEGRMPFRVIRDPGTQIVTIENMKERIGKAVQPSKLHEITMTKVAQLNQVMRGAQKASKQGWAAARRAFAEKEYIRAQKKYRERLIRAIRRDVPDSVDFFYREAIRLMQDAIDFKAKTEDAQTEKKSLQKHLDAHPEQADEIPSEMLDALEKKDIISLSNTELEEILGEMNRLRDLGRLKSSLYKKQRKRALTALRKEMTQNIDAAKGYLLPNIERANTLRPNRIFDDLDGGKNDKGPIYRFFYGAVNEIQNVSMRISDTRRKDMDARMKELAFRLRDFAKTRIVGEIKFTVDELLSIWAGWKNPESQAAFRYGGADIVSRDAPVLIDDALYSEIDSILTEKEKLWADTTIQEYSDNYHRLRLAVIRGENRDPGRVVNYTPIRRIGVSGITTEEELIDELAVRNFFRQKTIAKGMTLLRKDIPAEFQTPLKTGLTRIWHAEVKKQEHYINTVMHLKDMRAVSMNKEFRAAVEKKFGEPMNQRIEHYLNVIANPDFYRTFSGIERLSKMGRRHVALAYIAYRLATPLKQLTQSCNYWAHSSIMDLLTATLDCAVHPREAYASAKNIHYQIAHSSIERELSELEQTERNRYLKIVQQVGHVGMYGVHTTDLATRIIGINAVYNWSLRQGLSPAEAADRAARVTLKTQESAFAKDLPQLYATSEFLNWSTMFTNELNQIYNITTRDIPKAVYNKHYQEAGRSAIALAMGAVLIYIIEHDGDIPDEPEELALAFGSQALSTIPIVGNHIASGVAGWNPQASPPATAGAGVGRALSALASGNTEKAIEALVEPVSVGAGFPYQAAKDALEFIE